VVREDFPLAATMFPSLEDLHIGECTLAASMSVTSDTMPRLKHLRFTNVSVRTDDTKAAITVLADDLRILLLSCRWYSKTESPSEPLLFVSLVRHSRVHQILVVPLTRTQAVSVRVAMLLC